MGPKKLKPNGFFAFMQEMKGRMEREGHVFRNIQELHPICTPLWNTMSPEQKADYNQKAKGMAVNVKEEKYDTRGVPLSWKENEEKRKVEKQKLMTEEIENLVAHYSQRGVLVGEHFYIAHFNYAVETEEQEYPPCELGLVKYSLESGIVEHYHEFIDPGKLRLGYSFAAKQLADETHKIPMVHELASKNYVKITEKLKAMLKQQDGKCAPLFFLESELKKASFVLEWLVQKSCQQDPSYDAINPFRAYSLNKLLYELRRYADLDDQRLKFTSNQMVADRLTASTFDFSPNIACQFHDEADCTKFCALTRVRAFAYVISDYCCEAYRLRLMPLRHCPAEMVDETKYEVKPQTLSPRSVREDAEFNPNESCSSDVPRLPQSRGVTGHRLVANFSAGRGIISGAVAGSSRASSSPGLSSVTSNSPVQLPEEPTEEEFRPVARGRGRIAME